MSVTEISCEGKGAGSLQPEMPPRRKSGRHETQATPVTSNPASALIQRCVLPTDLPAGEHGGPQRLEQEQPAHRPPPPVTGSFGAPPAPPPFSDSAHTCFPPDPGDAILQADTRGRGSAHASGLKENSALPSLPDPTHRALLPRFPAHRTRGPPCRGPRQRPRHSPGHLTSLT